MLRLTPTRLAFARADSTAHRARLSSFPGTLGSHDTNHPLSLEVGEVATETGGVDRFDRRVLSHVATDALEQVGLVHCR